jgi:uncharacterized membrane protein
MNSNGNHQSFEAKLQKNRKLTERIADEINKITGSFGFFLANLAFFVFWIAMNSGKVPGLPIVDPFPFILLTMIVSLEAIFLSIFVLISQNRQSTIASIREEIHLQINQIAEREITKILKLVSEIHEKTLPNASVDPEVKHMLSELDTVKIEKDIEKELGPSPMLISELLEKAEEKIFRKKRRS